MTKPYLLAIDNGTQSVRALLFDLHGNLHEWVVDADGTFRGGFYVDVLINGPGCTYATTAHTSTYHDYSTGFRCCRDADDVETIVGCCGCIVEVHEVTD